MGTLKMGFGIFVMVAAVYLGVQFVPPYLSNYQFQDEIKNEATINTYNTKPEDAIRDTILRKAQDLDIPLTKDQIKVQRTGPIGSGAIVIDANYQVHIDLPGYPVDLNFNAGTRNKGVW
ncbi:MAG TPA: hypothetical protein VH437_08855 [Terriglobales bacterium]|jgi:hypothetical protein